MSSDRDHPDVSRTPEPLAALAGSRPGGAVALRERDGRTYLVVGNEFATVWLEMDERATGVRLIVTDAETGTSIGLDPLELEAISRMAHHEFDERILERGAHPENRPVDRP
jgi:hypothetical protein